MVMHHFFHAGISFLAKGSAALTNGNLTWSVRVAPNGILTSDAALTAHPLALSIGAIFLFLSLSHAMIMLGPDMRRSIARMTRMACHHLSAANPAASATSAEPIMPRAIPIAANMPANLAISNCCGVALGSAGVSCSLAVVSDMICESFSAALLLIRSSAHLATLLYGDQNACLIEMGLSMILVIVAS